MIGKSRKPTTLHMHDSLLSPDPEGSYDHLEDVALFGLHVQAFSALLFPWRTAIIGRTQGMKISLCFG